MTIRKSVGAFLFLFSLLGSTLFAQSDEPPFLKYTQSAWVDSVLQTLSPDERIAQLISVAAYSNRDEAHKQALLQMIKKYKIGGLVFFQGGPGRQARMLNDLQKVANVPLLVSMDAEWGIGMRLDSTISYPFQMTLGAIQDDNMLYQMGLEVARQMKRAGMHMNFAPVVDVNNNPANPVINFRSFGEDKENVARKGIAYMRGMQDENILTTAKHFPGHGDTDTDSHYALPQINHPRARLDSLEIYPFRKIIEAGVGGVMVAHLNIPALDPTEGLPSTLSKSIVTGILKDELGFEGLIVTDAMNMKGVTAGNEPGVVDKDAILAGNDLLEFTEDVPRTIAEIRKAIEQGIITQEQIDERCRKILAVKQWVGLDNYQPVAVKNIASEMTTPAGELLNRKLIEAALTVLENENSLLPIRQLDTLKIASVAIGAKNSTTSFQRTLSLYAKVDHLKIATDAGSGTAETIRSKIANYDVVLVSVHDNSKYPRNRLKLSASVKKLLSELTQRENTVLTMFKNPYVLDKLPNPQESDGLIVAYQDNRHTEELAAQLIFGGIGASGTLPVSIGNKYQAGDGIEIQGDLRFGYTLPEDVGLDSRILYSRIDSLVNEAINAKAIPGCQVLVAKDRKVVMHKAYGLQQYSDTVSVKLDDLYDLASITKISSALPALMKLHSEGNFDLSASLGDYLPYFKNSNKDDATFREILAHQAKFKPWIAYWQSTLRNNGSHKWFTIKSDSSRRFPTKLTDNMWLHRNYKKKIYKAIKKSPLEDEAKYKYSGLAFYLFPEMVEELAGEDYAAYINDNFYQPLGATTLTFRPFEKFPLERIVPTENDYLFRGEPIHGPVHDEGAILMGGVSANAGLFANANDLAKLIQMYLEGGEYGGQRYIGEETIQEFTRYQFPENDNRRGLGFDKPNIERSPTGNAAVSASDDSFGHSGFTGTFTWADPEHGLLYVFLANRVHPTRDNTRLYQLNTRTNIQQVIYDSLVDGITYSVERE
ncbi:MAG: glycoside hydrolase family 3 N-terminal domain-containing protein [Tunicatimonas sp.]|uniref:glycoside hydrolase family 3 N-terminal domain-containing protein n=1 Tax=Tunicatimonas sp. TaxID=1940096 RepID=UPI003C74266F